MEEIDVAELVQSLESENVSKRKKAAFTLQSVIGDPSFADRFTSEGGLPALQQLLLQTSANTLAYALASMYNLLSLDQGWEYITRELVERLVGLVASEPIVNVLRGTMSLLASAISRPQPYGHGPDAFSARELKPILESHPTFLEMLVSRLTSADHALCATALQLINALIRDALNNDPEWPKFVKRLQDLGVIKAAYDHMQESGLQELVQPLLEFQSLTRALLRKWKEIQVDFGLRDHRRALKTVYNASLTEHASEDDAFKNAQKDEPDRWRRLGFATESPAWDFEEVGYLGMMDMTDFVRKSESGFQNLVLEQSNKAPERRCPFARASLAITSILYDHFEVERADAEEQQRYVSLEASSNQDKSFRPLLLQWSRLHTSGVQAFFRLWVETGAELNDFSKIEELVRILVEHIVGLAPRSRSVLDVEQDIAKYELKKLRELQMELLELTHEEVWGQHLRQIRDELQHEAVQFIKEQRIRCLLRGSWFPNTAVSRSGHQEHHLNSMGASARPAWRYVRLSPNRRWLHYHEFASKNTKKAEPPALEMLTNKIDLSTVTSVVSNVAPAGDAVEDEDEDDSLSEGMFSDVEDGELGNNAAQSPSQAMAQGPLSNGAKSQSPQQQRPPSSRQPRRQSRAGLHNPQQRQHRRRRRDPADRTNTTITIHGILPAAGVPASAVAAGARAGGGGGGSSSVVATTKSNTTFGLHRRNQSSVSRKAAADSTQPANGGSGNGNGSGSASEEGPLLSVQTFSHAHAGEWIDGLLMLMGQAPITSETNNLVKFISRYGLRIRLLNVRFDDGDGDADADADADTDVDTNELGGDCGGAAGRLEGRDPLHALIKKTSAAALDDRQRDQVLKASGGVKRHVRLPDRTGLDDDYFYDIPV